MLTLFENSTSKLTDFELSTIVPLLAETISTKISPQHAIKNKHIVGWLAACRIPTSEIRVRIMINHIRNNNLVPCLIGGNGGYWVTDDPKVVDDQIESLLGRINSMRMVVESLKAQKQNLILNK